MAYWYPNAAVSTAVKVAGSRSGKAAHEYRSRALAVGSLGSAFGPVPGLLEGVWSVMGSGPSRVRGGLIAGVR